MAVFQAELKLIQTSVSAVAVAPFVRKGIVRSQLVACREKEEGSAHTVGDMQSAQRLHHRLHPVMVGRDREDPKRLPSELPLMLFPGMRREVGADFPLEARLQKIGASDGHRAAVESL